MNNQDHSTAPLQLTTSMARRIGDIVVTSTASGGAEISATDLANVALIGMQSAEHVLRAGGLPRRETIGHGGITLITSADAAPAEFACRNYDNEGVA